MKFLPHYTVSFLAALLGFAAIHSLLADDDDSPPSGITATNAHYGLFDLLDHRSSYGKDIFTEPFLIEDSDGSDTELRISWFHAKAGAARTDLGRTEFEQGFGPVTFEIALPYERDAPADGVVQGVGTVELSARFPIYQYVASSGFFDTTFGAAMEFGIPTTSRISKNAEYIPRIFNDLRIGSHITLQSVAGYSVLSGSGEDSGLHTFEYGCLLACTFQHKELPIPGLRQFIPTLEISGEKLLNHEDRHNSLLSSAGFRVNLRAIGPLQPSVGVAYVFPLNEAGREEVHHGIYTGLVFDF